MSKTQTPLGRTVRRAMTMVIASVRSGSWYMTGNGWRSAFRREHAPDHRGISIGFRVVQTDQ